MLHLLQPDRACWFVMIDPTSVLLQLLDVFALVWHYVPVLDDTHQDRPG